MAFSTSKGSAGVSALDRALQNIVWGTGFWVAAAPLPFSTTKTARRIRQGAHLGLPLHTSVRMLVRSGPE